MNDNENALKEASTNIESLICVRPQLAPSTYITAGFVGDTTCAACAYDELDSWKRCIGEAVEYMCQQRPVPEFIKSEANPTEWPIFFKTHFSNQSVTNPESIAGLNLTKKSVVALPKFLCVGESREAGVVISSGCAAGPDAETATLWGLHEVIERNVAEKWWLGRHPENACMLDLTFIPEIDSCIQGIRQGETQRITKVVMLDVAFDVYVTAAWSFDATNFNGFVCATAGNGDPVSSAQSALRELVQLEWGAQIAENRSTRSDFPSVEPDDPRLNLFVKTNGLKADNKSENVHHSIENIISKLDNFDIQVYGVQLHGEPGLSVIKILIETMVLHKPIFI